MSKATTGTATKTKKPSVTIQTGVNKASLPSSSPSSASKRLPGSAHTQQTPTTNGVQVNGMARPSRRPPRTTTRLSTSENLVVERKATIPPEPFMITERHILKKHRGKIPSMIVHMHPGFFRFDSQEGSFSYQSEMRMFIEHLQRKTIPHDLIEDFRRENVRFYDGWLIVKIVDHRSVAADTSASNGAGDDDKPFSIHNYNHFITPSPYASFPSKEQLVSSPPTKLERSASTDKENVAPEPKQEQIHVMPKVKPNTDVKEYMVALKPTELSRQTDLMLDFIAIDPKSRKPQAKSGPPSTPIGTVPPTPISEKPPPLKKQKLRIDPKDHLEYEARIINATAPPLYLEAAQSLEDADRIHKMLADPLSNEAPASPKSRKRTVAELAADDAHAKEQERFMLVMDAKGSGASAGNAGAGDQQAVNAAFQPRFERFNALDKIRQELREKARRESEEQMQKDEARRTQLQEVQEQERKRAANQAAIAAKRESALARQQQQAQQQQQQQQAQLQMQQQAQQQQAAQQANAQLAQRRNTGQTQATAIPPNMQSQMMAQASSPIIRQGTPNVASSPAAAGSRPMARNGSQGAGAGSPARPGSAMQHAHPNAAGMMRQPSGQGGPSRNGTPQLASGTPAMPNATPILRQGTPAHSIAQASPMASVNMGTPQMAVANMQGQMQNGMQNNMAQQQMLEMRRNQLMQQAQMNGQPMNPQMAQHIAQQQAQLQRQAAMQQRQQAGMQGTPQPQHMSPNPQQSYQAQVRKAMMQQMGQQGSPGAAQMSPQQMQQMQMMQQQQAMQNQQAQAQGQVPQQVQIPGAARLGPQAQAMFNSLTMQAFKAQMTQEAHRYGGNPGNIPTPVKHQLQKNAQQQAMATIQRRLAQQQQQQQAAQAGQQNAMMNPQAGQMMGQMGNMNSQFAAQQQQQNMQATQQQQQQQQMMINNVRQQMQAQQQAQAQAQGMNGYQAQLMQQQFGNQGQGGPR